MLNVGLYRSWRALLAFIVTLAICAAFTVGFVGLTHGVFTIVSSLVPMTILIVCTATLVYLHSRYVDRPEDRSVEDHQIFALCNKFLACTASIVASAVGFLPHSRCPKSVRFAKWESGRRRPLITRVTVFTLYPALVRILRCPTGQERQIAGLGLLPGRSPAGVFVSLSLPAGVRIACAVCHRRHRGVRSSRRRQADEAGDRRHRIHPARTEMYKSTKEMEKLVGGLSITNVWLQGKPGMVSNAKVLRG